MTTPLRTLPLHALHAEAGARFVPFAGWNMPVRYGTIREEHMAVRTHAGLFDVSHMGEVRVRGPAALAAVQRLITNDLHRIADGRALYTVMCNPDGGVVDDLIVYRMAADDIFICVNAGNRDKDFAWISAHLEGDATATDEGDSWVQLALQGPAAVGLAATLDPRAATIPGFGIATLQVAGVDVLAARTGYTGEDGFEFYIPVSGAETVARALFALDPDLRWIGLGARDSLRIEARLPLYGHELAEDIDPLSAGLGWVVKWDAGDFIGRDALEAIRQAGVPRRLRGLVGEPGQGMLREGADVTAADGSVVGRVTSSSLGFMLDDAPISIAFVMADHCNAEHLHVSVRGRQLPVRVLPRPFYQRSPR
jgi:aminomethyltransferase